MDKRGAHLNSVTEQRDPARKAMSDMRKFSNLANVFCIPNVF
jgi:hypothetical protein